jgi:ribosomal protein L7/L12
MVVVSGAVSLTVSTHFKPTTTAAVITATAAGDASADASADNCHSVSVESGASHKLAVIKAGEVFPAHVSSILLSLTSSSAVFDHV